MSHSPLTNVMALDGKKARVQRTATGWHIAATGVTARVKGYRDGIICRVAPGADPDVVQLGIGPATSRLCNAIYSPSLDVALVFAGDDVQITPARKKGQRVRGFSVSAAGPLTVTVLEQYYRVHRNLPWFTPLQRDVFPRPPAGWCSWYYYYTQITEAEMTANTDWLAAHLQPFGCEWVQLDDGWQGRGTGLGSNRNWFVTCERDFPHGMKWLADYIRARNFRPGIWAIPLTQSDAELFTRIPALFLRDEDGASPGEHADPREGDGQAMDDRLCDWAGRYYLDPTGPEGQAYLKRLFTMLCDEWGYDYVKIDAQGQMPGIYATHRKRLADPTLEGSRAYRLALEAAKGVMGKGRFLLNCGGGWPAVGLCEGIRTGGDIYHSWDGLQPAVTATLQWLYLNTIAFYTDPDAVLVRDPLTLEQARLWATLVGITGQLLMASDKMTELPDARVELLRRIFPVADIHPMELYPLSTAQRPTIFDLKVNLPNVGRWDVAALFNWSDEAHTVTLSPERLGLAGDAWVALDAWNGTLLHDGDGTVTVDVPAQGCRVVSLWPRDEVPHLVGTSRHLTQGAVDVKSVEWDGKKRRLTGVSHVVGGDPYRVYIYVPEGYVVASDNAVQDGKLATLTLTHEANEKTTWQVLFARTS
jgi:hypothetical protein